MELIKENQEKLRAVYRLDHNTIRKYWYGKNIKWSFEHKKILDQLFPNYVKSAGSDEKGVYIDFNYIFGVPANIINHDKEFFLKVVEFVIKNLKETLPYAQGDWVLSNIIINKDKLTLCDWDNVGIYPLDDIKNKMQKDLKSAFGEIFNDEVFSNTFRRIKS